MNQYQAIARVISAIFSPIMMPTYGILIALFCTYMNLSHLSVSTRLVVVGSVFVGTAVVPMVVIQLLHRVGIIHDSKLNDRVDRFLPLCAAVTCFCGITFYLSQIHAPSWITHFMLAATAAAFTMLVVSMKWKISGHATGVGGFVGFAYVLYYRSFIMGDNPWLLYAAVLVAGLVCTSRLLLKRHDMPQIIVGFVNGLAWILICEFLLADSSAAFVTT